MAKDISEEELEQLYEKIDAEEPMTEEELWAEIERLNRTPPHNSGSTEFEKRS